MRSSCAGPSRPRLGRRGARLRDHRDPRQRRRERSPARATTRGARAPDGHGRGPVPNPCERRRRALRTAPGSRPGSTTARTLSVPVTPTSASRLPARSVPRDAPLGRNETDRPGQQRGHRQPDHLPVPVERHCGQPREVGADGRSDEPRAPSRELQRRAGTSSVATSSASPTTPSSLNVSTYSECASRTTCSLGRCSYQSSLERARARFRRSGRLATELPRDARSSRRVRCPRREEPIVESRARIRQGP